MRGNEAKVGVENRDGAVRRVLSRLNRSTDLRNPKDLGSGLIGGLIFGSVGAGIVLFLTVIAGGLPPSLLIAGGAAATALVTSWMGYQIFK